SPWRLPLDRAVRYAVSDALASVKSHMYDLEYAQRRSPQELATWNNYLAELRALHQLLLALPSLETAQWLKDDQAIHAPTFTPFVNGITDAKTSIRRVYNWLHSLPQTTSADSMSGIKNNSVLVERQRYIHQIDKVFQQLQRLPAPGSDAWYAKYKPVMEPVSSVSPQQPLVRAVA
ncbi:MAG: hypothetical protein AAGA83_24700, partial [Cyanobacteria bacterium P01_F01_bin.116]